MVWESQPENVIVMYAKRIRASRIQSTAGHEESRGKSGGPPSKPKYYPMTDSEKYCEGTVKRTPGGE